uniref:Cytochrome b n=1 Tax=Fornicia albalata TaxID=1911503 RepID=A0A6F8ACS3_9HYME|nr:cytochrome b [Fornicia albalata]
MNKSLLKKNLLMNLVSNMMINLPTPININIWWNLGSMLGLCLMMQILTGLLMSMHYVSNVTLSFISIIHIMQDVNYGWLMRLIHINGASFFFIFMYMHIARGMYYGSYKLIQVWTVGVIIILLLMMTAFMGYILPWGQMSFWGASVITNLVSTIPYFGTPLVYWLWGGFSVENPTLNRFYSLHFILPFILTAMILIHLILLHESGSNNPLGLKSNFYKINFHPYFSIKDLAGFLMFLTMIMLIIMQTPYYLADPENSLEADSFYTPMHIQPEWYFLFAFTILRSIPNKFCGVIALITSILILLIMPLLKIPKFQSMTFYPMSQILFWFFIGNMYMLTYLGTQYVEPPFSTPMKICSLIYFMFFFINNYSMNLWDKMLS